MDTAAVGRNVRFVLPSDSVHAGLETKALITTVFASDVCNLTVLCLVVDGPVVVSLNGYELHRRAWSASYDEGKAPGTWHWPDRV